MIIDSVIRHIQNNIKNLKVSRHPNLIVIEYKDYWIFFADHNEMYYRTTVGLFDYSSNLLDLGDPNALEKLISNLERVMKLIDVEHYRV